jgi:crotonobetainyl-CoA:carnitine CoA-transferase CaiB-like acyl-CoA transferase
VSGPLSGIKVVDLSRVLAGPWASQLLADYGAEVIKIEKPVSGDDTRQWGPPWLIDNAGQATRESAYFLSANRNKRSVTADLGHPDGRALVADLAAGADVLIENFRVGALQKFGLDSASLRARNPRLVYCSISAYGQSGARSSLPGYDAMIQAEGGLMSITGAPDEEGGEPQKVGVAVADIMTGMYAATAVLAALEARHRDGNGQYIDVPLYHTQVAWLANQAQNYLMTGKSPARLGTAHPNIVPYQAFATADGHLMLAVGNDRQFTACMQCLGRAELARDHRFRSNAARVQNRAELIAVISAKLLQRPSAKWLDDFAKAGIPAGRINTLETVFSENFATETGLVHQLPHALATTVPAVSNPVHFSATPVQYHRAAPILGEHTEEVLARELGYSPEKIAALRDKGAI